MDGEQVLNRFKRTLGRILPENIKPRFVYKGTKLGSFFSVKDQVDINHQTNLVYSYTPQGGSRVDYVGETNVRFGRRAYEHGHWDKSSAIYKYGQEQGIDINFEDFKIIERGYPKNLDRRIAEALYVKDVNPILNGQKQSYKLQLFN